MKEMILKMVTNKTLFHPGNLLLDPKNPCADMPDDGCYGDVNTGTWYQTAKKHEYKLPNHIYLCLFATLLMDCQWTNMRN